MIDDWFLSFISDLLLKLLLYFPFSSYTYYSWFRFILDFFDECFEGFMDNEDSCCWLLCDDDG